LSKTVCTALISAFIAAGIFAGSTTSALAYDYRIGSAVPLKSVWLHTVSAFCHDRSWSGNWAKQGNPVRMSTASICLVDRVEVITTSNQKYSWSGVGIPSQTIWLQAGINGMYIDVISGSWMH
jgi:hypothetical protein